MQQTFREPAIHAAREDRVPDFTELGKKNTISICCGHVRILEENKGEKAVLSGEASWSYFQRDIPRRPHS